MITTGRITKIPWSRVVLEKPIAAQLVNKFPALHGTRKFSTTFKTVHEVRDTVRHFVRRFFFFLTVRSC